MKKWKFCARLLTMLLLCSACTNNQTSIKEVATDTQAPQDDRIELLEAELAQMKQKEQLYQAQIALLEARTAQTDDTNTSAPLAERVTFHYRVENGGAVITGYTGNTALLSIPATLDGLPVTAIGEHAFERASLTAVILPDSVVSIGWFAFYECQSLAGVTLPASVSTIGYAVFDGCPALTLRCPVGSYAEQYAKSYAIPYTNL